MDSTADQIRERAKEVSDILDADILLYVGEIDAANIDRLIRMVRAQKNKRPNVALILTTYGGDPDDAYRLARYLKRNYQKFLLFVFGYCKSAGTLIAVGADEVIMSDFGELGPLDIQLLKTDELITTSSLSYYQAMVSLREEAYSMFESHFLEIKSGSNGGISTKTAAEIGTALTIGILAPIASQVDPLRLGEVGRATTIAYEYGSRLSQNDKGIVKLTTGYSSHSFTIDLEEAREILHNVRPPVECEYALEELLFDIVRKPICDDPRHALIKVLYSVPRKGEEINNEPNELDTTNDTTESKGNRPVDASTKRDAKPQTADERALAVGEGQ